MSDVRVASRYAKSLFELAREKGVVEEVNRDMQLFERVGNENKNFLLMLKNPIIDHSKKLSILRQLFEARVNPITMSIFDITVKKHREAILYSVAKEFHNLYNQSIGIEKAEVTTVVALTEANRTRFKEIIRRSFGKEVELKEKIDSDLLGGYILKVGDRQIDESLSNKLQQLKREFSYNPYVKEI